MAKGMIVFKINSIRYNFPTEWGDVCYRDYITLLSLPNSLIHYISLFTGIKIEVLKNAEYKNLEKIAIALSFLTIPPKFEAGPTAMVGPYVLPKDVTVQSLGQFEDLRGLIMRIPPEYIEKIQQKIPLLPEEAQIFSDLQLEACAIYVQKIKDGKYDSDKVPAVKEQLMNYSCMEITQTGAFFLFKPLNILTGTQNPYQRIIQRLKRSLQDLPGYQKSLDFLLRSSKNPNG